MEPLHHAQSVCARGRILALIPALACALAPPAAEADTSIYVSGFNNEFGTLDLNTGGFTPIGTFNLPAGDVMYGMGFGANGMLYGVDSEFGLTGANLWQINPANADVTLIGSIGETATDASSDAAGKLFVISQDTNALYYTMNPPSASPNVVGPLGLSSDGLAAVSADGSQLFTSTPSPSPVVGDDLISINPSSGATSDVGSMGFFIDNGLFVNGTLYGFGFETSLGAIVTINTTTGSATQVGTYVLPGGDQIVASALLTPAAVPEPSGLVLGLIGAAVGVSCAVVRRRTPA